MILKRIITYLSMLLACVACNKFNGPKKPDNLISKEKMVAILIDAKLISSANSVNKMIMKNNGIDLDTYIFTKHDIDSLQFALSNHYYAFHLKDYEDIYNKVEDSLKALETKYKDLEAQQWKETTKQEEDSLKAVFKQEDVLNTSDSLKMELNKNSFDKPLKNKIKKNRIKPVLDTLLQQKK